MKDAEPPTFVSINVQPSSSRTKKQLNMRKRVNRSKFGLWLCVRFVGQHDLF
jgi:hypothetical protein